jgi:hypothetical protein
MLNKQQKYQEPMKPPQNLTCFSPCLVLSSSSEGGIGHFLFQPNHDNDRKRQPEKRIVQEVLHKLPQPNLLSFTALIKHVSDPLNPLDDEPSDHDSDHDVGDQRSSGKSTCKSACGVINAIRFSCCSEYSVSHSRSFGTLCCIVSRFLSSSRRVIA